MRCLNQFLFPLLLMSSLAIPLPRSAAADDLLSVYDLALQADPVYQAAIAAHQAALEVAPQSRAALLPSIGISGLVSRDRYDPRGGGDTSYATNRTYSVGLRQAIYQRASILQLEQADSSIAQADAQLAAALQDLMLRVATRYFLVLGAQDNLEFVQADKEAIGRTLEQAQKRFEVGLAAITDTLDAQARYDIAVSDEINAEKLLDDAREALRELTGQLPVAPEILQDEIPLLMPDPASQEQWVTAAMDQNPLLLAAIAASQVAKQEIQVQNSGHYPSLDMTADYSYRDNQFGGISSLERNDSAIGLELTLPIYQGGLITSRTRQSRDLYSQALEEQESQRRATERQARDTYRGVISNISKVEALQNAVISNQKAVEAAEAGFEVGTRSIVDVLDAQRELLRARRDHARSRYDYLLDTLRLKQAAGILAETDLAQINNLLIAGNEVKSER
jgi:outer membrane protein